MSKCDVAIIGAGPYGLSAAVHLRTIPGLDVRIFGDPMSFWEQNMPVGMLLRSNWTATQIADPHHSLTLEAFQKETGRKFYLPVPLDDFVEYGKWYQQRGVPDVERKKITRVERAREGFQVSSEDGEMIRARRVVVAVGIGAFASRAQEFATLPSALASHASEHKDLGVFRGKKVLVVGGGQSALESAALLHENGAEVEVVARREKINWLQGWLSKTLHHRMGTGIRHLLYAPTDVGPAVLSQLLARPHLVRQLPRSVQDRLWKRAVRPAGARWLVDRLKPVPIHLGRSVVSASVVGDKVRVRLDDGSERTVDHVLMGTGYKVDVAKYQFFSSDLVNSINRVRGYPVLRSGLETSVDGLHILGAPAAWSFGPLMQFVSGSTYACQSLTKCLAAKPALASVSVAYEQTGVQVN